MLVSDTCCFLTPAQYRFQQAERLFLPLPGERKKKKPHWQLIENFDHAASHPILKQAGEASRALSLSYTKKVGPKGVNDMPTITQ